MRLFYVSVCAVLLLLAWAPLYPRVSFYITKTVFLMPQSYYYVRVHPEGKDVKLILKINSTEPVDVYVMGSAQIRGFLSGQPVSSLFSSSGISVSAQVNLMNDSDYYVLVSSSASVFPALVTISYATIPVGIHVLYGAAPAPVGIVDYGVMNSSKGLMPYVERIMAAIGQANISSMMAYNPLFPSPYAASLQLNLVLQVNTTAGQQDYLVQNVIEFNTKAGTFNLADNVWNLSSPTSFISSSAISGNGLVATEPWMPPWAVAARSVYLYTTRNLTYVLPLSVTLKTGLKPARGGVTLLFSSNVNGANYTYDRVHISASGVVAASFLVDGYSMTPVGNYYDAELVFGGGYGGEATQFTSMNASLSLVYMNAAGIFVRPPALYGFGSDTAESTYDLAMICPHGKPLVEIGNPNFVKSFTNLSYPIPSLENRAVVGGADRTLPSWELFVVLVASTAYIVYQYLLLGKEDRGETLSNSRQKGVTKASGRERSP
ncbi:MAG: thermopsin [Thermoprotei archaeon]